MMKKNVVEDVQRRHRHRLEVVVEQEEEREVYLVVLQVEGLELVGR
jgi:hypothetical protein